MNRQKLVDFLGYGIALGVIVGGLLSASQLVAKLNSGLKLFAIVGYILAIAIMSILRIHLFYKIPKSERRVYDWTGFAWRTSLILHPVSQMIIMMFLAFVAIIATI